MKVSKAQFQESGYQIFFFPLWKVLPIEEGSEILSQLLLFINLISILIQSGPSLRVAAPQFDYYNHTF